MRRATLLILSYAPLLGLAGCPSAGSKPPGNAASQAAQPIVFQLQQQDDSLQDQRFRTLLDFEHEGDLVFAQVDGNKSIARVAHTGSGSLAMSGATATFRVSSVLFSTKLPGAWTLLGTYVQPQIDTPATAELLSGDRVIARSRNTIAAGRWSFAGVDLTAPEVAQALEGTTHLSLRMTFDAAGGIATTHIDDVLLIDNAKTLLDTLAAGPGGWKISRRGHTTTIDAPNRFKVDVQVAASSDKGWLLAEYSPMRVVLRSAGPVKTWVLYNDGRFIQDGKLTVKGASGEGVAESHADPATIAIDESAGKLDAFSDGDRDNDGYNESLGAYQVTARAPRLPIRIQPGRTPMASPVFEIRNLPPGEVTANVEGRLLETAARLPDGRVLLNVPLRVDRPMTITVRAAP
jgi:hypothetical protein